MRGVSESRGVARNRLHMEGDSWGLLSGPFLLLLCDAYVRNLQPGSRYNSRRVAGRARAGRGRGSLRRFIAVLVIRSSETRPLNLASLSPSDELSSSASTAAKPALGLAESRLHSDTRRPTGLEAMTWSSCKRAVCDLDRPSHAHDLTTLPPIHGGWSEDQGFARHDVDGLVIVRKCPGGPDFVLRMSLCRTLTPHKTGLEIGNSSISMEGVDNHSFHLQLR